MSITFFLCSLDSGGGSNVSEKLVQTRWSPQEKDVENMLQSIRRGKYLDPDDQKATYEFLKAFSKVSINTQRGSRSLANSISSDDDCDVLFYQEFKCHCHDEVPNGAFDTQGSGRQGKQRLQRNTRKQKCEHSSQCSPFIAVLQSPWQREALKTLKDKRLADVFCVTLDEIRCSSARRVRKPRLVF
jgi:hypothetical protein